jgi:hypothetical protein
MAITLHCSIKITRAGKDRMKTACSLRLAILMAGLAAAGCVDRRFIILSNVPSAQVYIDNRPIGPAPAHASFEYYGYYNITVVQPGFETLNKRVHVVAPWYAYPPFDFMAEVLWPFRIEDVRRYTLELTPATPAHVNELIQRAEELRQRGLELPPPSSPPKPPKLPTQPVSPLGPPVLPSPEGALPPPGATPLPPPSPLFPSVAP